jgi:tetratricopeptide (TPR) repeat protein
LQEALRQQTQALDVDPGFAPAYIERAILHRAMEAPQAALTDAQAAVGADPENATAYALLGEILRLEFNDPFQALAAYDRAVRLDPTLAEATFLARWQTAVAANLPGRMVLLADEYVESHPDDPLAPYYRARALTALGNHSGAVEILSGVLEETSLAALWLALGDAYMADEAWTYALTCYEQARGLAEEGDNSLNLISEVPAAELFGSLGAAYFHTGRCSDARNMLNHALAIGPDRSEYHTLLGRAMICLTPTPTPTPHPLFNQ